MVNFTTDAKICIERELRDTYLHEFNDIYFHFDLANTFKWIQKNNFAKVCLQFPDELLSVSSRIYEEIKNNVDVDLYILGDTSYASCCVDSVAAMHVQADAIVHYGRTCFSNTSIPVFTVLPKRDLDVVAALNIMKMNFEANIHEKLCLFYDIEFEHIRDDLTKLWHMQYPHSYIAYIEMEDKPNRFLGRIIKNINGEEFALDTLKDCICIYVGTRGESLFNFTISVAAKDWYLLDASKNCAERMNETTWFKRRRYLIEKCKDAKLVGILVCQLSGEQTKDIILRMKQLCKVNGKKSYIISVGKPNVAKLANFPEIDIYVMIACPENDLYSNRDFYKPLVYPFELEVALNSNREQYYVNHITDYTELLPGQRHYSDIQHLNETDVSLITGRIREFNVGSASESSMDLEKKQNWALESIGKNLQERTWKGLEQKLGETEVTKVEEGRKGIPLHYANEPE